MPPIRFCKHQTIIIKWFDSMTDNRRKCKNCHSFFDGNYCNNCGQKGDEERFTLSNLMETFLHGFYHVHSGILFTIKELFVRPGEMLRGYISGRRVVYLNPFTFLVLVCLVGGFAYNLSGMPNHINEIMLASGETIRFTSKHLSYRVLLTIPSYAIMCSIIYKSFDYNFAEYIIINTFLMSQSIAIMVLWMLVVILIKPNNTVFEIFYDSAIISFIIFQIIVFFRLFNKGNIVMRCLKASVTVIAGFSLSFILINFGIKFITFFKG